MHGPREPAWNYVSDQIDFTARLSYIFQSGIPKIDLVFYQYLTTYPNLQQNYQPIDLEGAGKSRHTRGIGRKLTWIRLHL